MVIKYSALLFSEKGCLFHGVCCCWCRAGGVRIASAYCRQMHEILFNFFNGVLGVVLQYYSTEV